MGARDKEKRILQGLAQALGLEAEADPVAVLRTVATTLGCTVEDDGTTMLTEASIVLPACCMMAIAQRQPEN